jgi:RNA polymerase sigma factor (sigma-70 family)
MHREDLEKLRGLRAEIESLRHIRPKPRTVSIFYKDYRTGIGIPKTDVGMDSGEEERAELAKKILRKERQLARKVSEIEDWLESVPDPEMRTILRYYYEEGLSQREIGEKLGYERSTITHRLHVFWMIGENHEKE